MSSEQVRNLKTDCNASMAVLNAPAEVNGPRMEALVMRWSLEPSGLTPEGFRVTKIRG